MEIVDTILKTNTAELIAYLRGGGDPNFSEDDSGLRNRYNSYKCVAH